MRPKEIHHRSKLFEVHSRRLNISIDDIILAEMIIKDSLSIDFSKDQLISLEALKVIPYYKVHKHFHNALELLNFKPDDYKSLWFDFIYHIHLNYDLAFINSHDLTALSPQEETNKIAFNILETWFKLDEDIDFDNKINNDTLHQLIGLQAQYLESQFKDESKKLIESIKQILESSMMNTYINENESDTSYYLMLFYFAELCQMNKSKNITSILIRS